MSTWRIGDSWITTHGVTVGTGSDKAAAVADAERRKSEKDEARNAETNTA